MHACASSIMNPVIEHLCNLVGRQASRSRLLGGYVRAHVVPVRQSPPRRPRCPRQQVGCQDDAASRAPSAARPYGREGFYRVVIQAFFLGLPFLGCREVLWLPSDHAHIPAEQDQLRRLEPNNMWTLEALRWRALKMSGAVVGRLARDRLCQCRGDRL